MATLYKEGAGTFRIQFKNPHSKKRDSIRIQTSSKRDAADVQRVVEKLISVKAVGGSVDAATASFLAGIGPELHGAIANVGLTERRDANARTLGWLTDEFASLAAVKPQTLVTYKQTLGSLENFLKRDRHLAEITAHDGDKWQASMKEEGLAPATISKRTKTAKQVFASAVKWRLLDRNPFTDLKAGSQANRDRFALIPIGDFEKLLRACPDAEWRCILALSRLGGLRCPSEVLALRWSDIDWKSDKFTVTSDKTERHGKGHRTLPLFPDLAEILRERLEQAPHDSEFVIERYRAANCNLRTQFERIIKRAGLKPWSRLFHNLRATRQTELTDLYPAHVVSAWLGNTVSVATTHYLGVTDAHFDRAIKARQMVHNPVQQSAEPGGTAAHTTLEAKAQVPCYAVTCAAEPPAAGNTSDPDGIRTHVTSVKGMCPGPG